MPPEPKERKNRATAERQEEFLNLLNPVYEQLERFCFAVEYDREQAYDLIGETILRAYEHFEGIRDQKAFLSWLFTTAIRLQRRAGWRRRHFAAYDESEVVKLRSDIPSPDTAADLDPLYRALGKLPRKEREAIVLFEINDLPLKEILAIQGGTLSALKVRLHRARKRLARLLGVKEGGAQSDSDSTRANNANVLILP
ncbi:MAG: RNA polymerase sigma factor [Ignavibacteriae bacterium]|nr:RNA polymerase sigma factor [Ignavibacteriota bacterium]